MEIEKITLQLVIDIEYEMNGTLKEVLMAMLLDVGNRAFSEGLFTGDTEAHVVEVDMEVAEIEDIGALEDFSRN